MSSKSTDPLIETILFELIERISVFHIHLRETDARFYPPRRPQISELHFVDSYNECLSKMIYAASGLDEVQDVEREISDKTDEVLKKLGKLIGAIGQLHTDKLGHLPRPPESPELKRFGRILQKHVVKLEQNNAIESDSCSGISIYLSEEISETVFAGDPLVDFKIGVLNELLRTVSPTQERTEHTQNAFKEPSEDSLGYHLTIARMDSTNPCRWPTIVHEVGHRVIKNGFFKNGDIQKDFEYAISAANIAVPKIVSDPKKLKSWLTECWCDLLGVILIGPSFWFAQWSSFLFHLDNAVHFQGSDSHPPMLFRLYLISKVLKHRFPETVGAHFTDISKKAVTVLRSYDHGFPEGFIQNQELRQLVLLFQDFFFGHFFRNENGTLAIGERTLNEELRTVVKYTEEIGAGVIEGMVTSLNEGIPIPSVPIQNGESWQERPSTVQEILLSAWLYRSGPFQQDVLAKFRKIAQTHKMDPVRMWNAFLEDIVKCFDAFNFAVLRSIQVSEWFDLLGGSQCDGISKMGPENSSPLIPKSVLSDSEIFHRIESKDIKVIPIMHLFEQLGSSSLDVRLGTSFQVYHPNHVGILDFTDDKSVLDASMNSTLVDLDFLEAITISPGQFMLGHTMEFICLPATVAAEIEGRSSFARLGIEIHMTAGFVDPGFRGVLTLEIFNAGPNPVRLFPGLRIAQLRFLHCSEPCKPYNRNPAAKYRGLLQHHNSLSSRDYEVNRFAEAISQNRYKKG